MAPRLISAFGREAIDLLIASISIIDNRSPGSPMRSVVSLSASSVSPWRTFYVRIRLASSCKADSLSPSS
eukprot:7721326-Pyramimonas_sp.AAC.1